MANPRKPTSLKVLQGTYRKDRANPNEPKPTNEIGNAPEFFTENQSVIWSEIVETVPKGVLTCMDRVWLEMGVTLIEKSRLNTINSSERSSLLNVLGKMGMNPSDRSRVSVAPEPAFNEWDDM